MTSQTSLFTCVYINKEPRKTLLEDVKAQEYDSLENLEVELNNYSISDNPHLNPLPPVKARHHLPNQQHYRQPPQRLKKWRDEKLQE